MPPTPKDKGEDFDDISSIYTAKEQQIAGLKRRVKQRDQRLSLLQGEDEELAALKSQMEALEKIEGQKMGDERLQERLNELEEIREEANQRADASALSGLELDLSN